jgi:hypothetical protein
MKEETCLDVNKKPSVEEEVPLKDKEQEKDKERDVYYNEKRGEDAKIR